MPKVSIIIPVYGVEKYIERCARSLLEQTLDDVEFLFIDDCSPDNSIDILQEVLKDYPKRESQVRIERMPHVRKHGVQLAKGDYIIACDSDDFVEPNMYLSMYEYALKGNFDFVQCDIEVVDETQVLRSLSSSKSVLESEELKQLIIDGDIANSLCNKLVKANLFKENHIIYPQYGMDEDDVLAVQLAYYSKRLGYINHAFYKAYFNSNSISHKVGEDQIQKRLFESFENSKVIVEFLKQHGYNDNSKAVIKAKLRPKYVLYPEMKCYKYVNKWKKTYPEINYMIIFDKRLPKGARIRALLTVTYLYPIVYKLLSSMKKVFK